jgi:predicted NAD/FAD-binding protein
VQAIDPATIVGEYAYAHPVFDLAAIEAQKRLPLIQGQQRTWFAGAWTGYGFHEDGLKSGLNVGRALQQLIHDQAQPVQEKWAA